MDYAEMRPFDFMVPFWGERYRDYFVDLALPSLLAPNNLCLLRAESGHRMLIATTSEDWHAIEHLPIMQRLRQHAIPIWSEVGGPPIERDRYAATIRHQHHCLKRLFEAAYERRGYGVQLYPDVVYSDGMVSSVIERARAGQHAVIGVAMRQAEEDVLEHLYAKGYLQRDVRLSLAAGCMNIAQREMAAITTAHLHPEMDLFDHGKPAPPFVSPFHYWRLPESRGIILHTFFTPMLPLIDFAVVPPNHAECLDDCDIAKDYVSKNFTDWSRIGVVQDSDEWACISLTPRASNRSPAAQTATHAPRWWSQLRRLSNLRESMRAYAADDVVRRQLFRLPIRWHAGDLDEAWTKEEQRIAKLIDRAAGNHSIDLVTFADSALRTWSFACRRWMTETGELGRRLWLAACGNDAARRWLSWRVNVLWRRMQGHTTHPSRPEVP